MRVSRAHHAPCGGHRRFDRVQESHRYGLKRGVFGWYDVNVLRTFLVPVTRDGVSHLSKRAVSGRKPTLHDVADLAGVSYQTVSRVVNRHPSVAKPTRARVLRAIESLDYSPNRVAQSLVTRRSNSVGILSSGTQYYGPAQMLSNIEAALKAEGYGLVYAAVDDVAEDELERRIAAMRGQLVDGLVLITPIEAYRVDEIAARIHMPFVMIDVNLGERVASVVIDQRHGGMLATSHLLELGHRRLAEISGPRRWSGAEQRHAGFLAALEAAGLTAAGFVESDWTAAGGFAACRRLLQGEPFTGIVVGNDQMALGALRALRVAGLAVPGDVSLVGFDDVPEAAYFDPPLTTVRQDFAALGQQAAELLLSLISTPQTPAHQRVLYPHLVVRASSAPPPTVPGRPLRTVRGT